MLARLPRAAALFALVAGLLAASPPTAHAATSLKGIDVSKWQGVIDWSTVATTSTRFVIVRATRGVGYDDPRFAANVAGARANGIETGAYHRATPHALKDGSADLTDARLEADHYLSVADPGFGDIIPALDIEVTGGMPPSELIAWVKKWVTRVTNETGLHAMLYASPNFWTTNMGDTTWFADHGYRLWLAHWNVPTPTVPANGWQGAGWTFWQWTHEPGLPGITGDLDRDRFDGTDLVTAEIARLTVDAGSGGSVTDATGRLACASGSSCSALYDPSSMVSLTATPDPGAVFLSWGGRCAAAGSAPTCLVTVLGSRKATATFGYPLSVTRGGPGNGSVSSSPAGIVCPSACGKAFPAGSTVALTASPDGASEFDAWSGACTSLDPAACTVTLDRPRSVTATFADLGPPSVDVTTPASLGGHVGFAFSEPVHAIDPADLILRVAGGTKVATTQVCRDTDGERVSCETGPVLGAALRPDAPLVAGQSYVAIANPNGVTSTILDRAANPLPTTTESFRAATDVPEGAPGAAFRWGTRADGRASGDSYLFERRAGASATFTVRGPTVTLWTVAGPGFGDTRIEIDGAFRTRLGGTRSSFAIVPRTLTGLGRGTHTLTAIALAGRPGDPVGTGIDTIADAKGTRSSPATTSAAWGPVANAQADGGRYLVSGVAGAQTTLRFRGTAIALRTIAGPAFGKAQLWIDGALVRRLDLSATSTTYGVLRAVSGLADRVHTVRVVVVGARGERSTGTNVALDGWLAT